MSEVSVDKPFQEPVVVKIQNGEEITLPRLTIGKIMAVTDAMSVLIDSAKEKSPEIFNIIGGKSGENVGVKLVETLPALFPLLLEQIVNVLSKYLGKDAEWIKDNMDMEDLVAVATPFFGGILKQGNHLLGPINEALAKIKS